ncbi:AI-2E family transporter [Exiguobacterium oxidotolerans]|uniref:Putative transport protein YueF n=1 Tax=Exiguobacterium oxidotolerans TaxID=223958 RepID=A0A653I8E3_9BACL|nr:AI-2E family transporter [Exiguobacterium oxidotolerans]VWX35041.1 putative transport protein YueF [Exiguobacterium oxidotolerans]
MDLLRNKWFKALLWILTIFLVIWVGTKISFLFQPIKVMLALIFPPLIIAGIFYYFTLGIVDALQKRVKKRGLAVLIVLLTFVGILTLIITLIGPILVKQVTEFVTSIPNLVVELRDQTLNLRDQLMDNRFISNWVQHNTELFDEWTNEATSYIGTLFKSVSASVGTIFGVISSTVLIVVLVPFILVYMLLDGYKFPDSVVKLLPKGYETETRNILHDMHVTVKHYVNGQVIVSLCVGLMSLIGFFISDIQYALLLALFCTVTNIIPYLGPYIGAVPAVIVGFIDDPVKALYAIITIVIAQQIESNLISPYVQGKTLKVHPLTIIIVLLVAGKIAGIIGVILAVPTYAVSKVVIQNIARIYRLRQQQFDLQTESSTIITDSSKS